MKHFGYGSVLPEACPACFLAAVVNILGAQYLQFLTSQPTCSLKVNVLLPVRRLKIPILGYDLARVSDAFMSAFWQFDIDYKLGPRF